MACVAGSLVGYWACSAKTSGKAARVTLVKFLQPDSWRLRRLFGRTTSTKASLLGLSEGSTISAFFFLKKSSFSFGPSFVHRAEFNRVRT